MQSKYANKGTIRILCHHRPAKRIHLEYFGTNLEQILVTCKFYLWPTNTSKCLDEHTDFGETLIGNTFAALSCEMQQLN